MGAYENNHYIPKFILRKFSDPINIYDVTNFALQTDTETRYSFAEKKIYPVDLEKEINNKLEAPFAKLLNEKLLSGTPGDKLILTRKELLLMKRFYILETVRTMSMTDVLAKSKQLHNIVSDAFNFKEKEIENETAEDRWHRTIKVIVETENPNEVNKHPLCTYEILMWSFIITSGYFAIWDCSDSGVDFLISDVGMTSEVEPSSINTGLEIEKKNELVRLINTETNIFKRTVLSNMLDVQSFFHENFYMFPLSKNRMIVTINPFFSLHRNKEDLPEPSVWPTEIKNTRLFLKNKIPKYPTFNGKPIYSSKDEFTYTIQKIDKTDAEYVNMLMLDRVEHYMGFADWSKIKSSVERYIEFHKEINLTPPLNYTPLIESYADFDNN